MTMTRADWRRRYYAPLPPNVKRVRVDHRDDELQRVFLMVMDLHSFGQFLYHDVIAHQGGDRQFDGTAEWITKAAQRGVIARPNKPFPLVQTRQALLIFNAHTMKAFTAWADQTRQPTFGSYLSYLRRHNPLGISVKPITDPFTKEAMLHKHKRHA